MDEQIQKWLYDIHLSIDEIENYFNQFPKDFNEYQKNIILKRAIERNLEIIGESMSRILKLQPDINIENGKKIIGLRNQIIHAYDNISDENIWANVINHIPKLKEEIIKLLKID